MADQQFPWEAYMQAVQQRNQNQMVGPQLIGQGLQSLGQAGGQALKKRAQMAQQQKIKDWLMSQAQANGPQQKTMNVLGRPNTPIASFDPMANQTTPTMTPGDPAAASLYSGLASAPPKIQDAALPKIFEQGFKAQGPQKAGKSQGSYWVNPNDPSEISPTKKDGFIEYKTSQADAGAKVTSSAQSKLRTKAMEGRVNSWNRSIDAKQINEFVKSTGFTPKMISSLQNTAVRGRRGLELLNDPEITWAKLHAAGVDFASIMHGGVAGRDEIANSTFPNWNQTAAKWDTYINGDVPANVPTEIRLQMQDMLSHVVALDGKFIDASNKYQKTMAGPTLPGGMTPEREKALKEIQGVMVPDLASGTSDYSKITDDELRRIAGGR